MEKKTSIMARLQEQNNIIRSSQCRKSIQHSFIIKTLNKLRENFLNPKKAVSEKHSANIILTVKDHRLSPLRSETRQGGPLEPLLFNMVIEFLARAISQENRGHPDWKRSKTISIPRRHDLIYRKSCQ